MKKKLISIFMAALMCFAVFGGCGSEPEPDNPDTPGGEAYVPTEKENTLPLVFGIDGADGVFSPFFSTAAYDTEITGMTQIGMLTSKGTTYAYGDSEACVVKDLDITYLDANNGEVSSPSKAKQTRYDFLIKKGVKFSDGVDLTIKDVLFNLYVYLDPAYTGSATLYSTDIVGLSAYRTQTEDADAGTVIDEQANVNAEERLNRIYYWLNNQYLLEQAGGNYNNLSPEQKRQFRTGLDDYEEEIKKDINYFIPFYKTEIENDYGSAQSAFEETIKENAYDAGEYWQAYFVDYGLSKRLTDTAGNYIKDEQGRYTYDFDGDGWTALIAAAVDDYTEQYGKDHDGATPSADEIAEAKKAAAIQLVYESKVGKYEDGNFVCNYIEFKSTVLSCGSTNTLYNELLAEERSKIIKNNENSGSAIRTISGITTSKTTTFRNETAKKEYNLDGEYDVLTIKINGIDPKAVWNFAFTVAPLHYYSYTGAGEEGKWNVENNFGVQFNNTEFMNNVLKASEKLGVPVGAGPYKATTATGLGDRTYPNRNEFKNANRVYYERNTYFDLLDGVKNGGPIQNAKVKYFQYTIVNSNLLLDKLGKNEIDVGTPNATEKTINNLLNYPNLSSKLVLTNGYGYVGINAGKIPDVWMRRAIMKAMDTNLINDYYKGDLCQIIYRPMSTQSWAYPKDAKSSFTFTDASGYLADYSYSETGAEIVKMLKDHDYAVNGDGTTVLSDPDGEALPEITFTVAGESTDHPAWTMFKRAESVLESIGFKINVKTDQFALKKLASGQLQVWAAAWSSTIDPDMYQVYHKDSTATSTLNWGYNEIKKDKSGKYAYEWSIVDSLSDLIDKGRQSVDNSDTGTRAQIYWKALDKVMELAVEMPTYQRNDLTVYNSDKIDTKTLNATPTAFDGLFSKIWEVGYTR